MLSVLDNLRLAADKKIPSPLILFDLSAAFDTVNHVQLLGRVQRLGASGTVLQWISSFLEDRSQRVQMGDCASRQGSLHWGVPQGSALSPLLFNIYLQPLIYALAKTDCQVFNYADDTQLIVRIDNTSATQGNVQNII